MFQCNQVDPESFAGKVIKCSCFANINTLNLVLCQKVNVAEMYITIKLGTQSKPYEQKYSQMTLAIQIKYMWFTLSGLVNRNE